MEAALEHSLMQLSMHADSSQGQGSLSAWDLPGKNQERFHGPVSTLDLWPPFSGTKNQLGEKAMLIQACVDPCPSFRPCNSAAKT